MWIRSQDKKILMKVDNINLGPNRLFTFVGGVTTSFTLGTYKSKERALEVLDEIEAFIENNYISIDDMPSHNNSPYPNYCPIHFTTMTRKKVFKMPEEE